MPLQDHFHSPWIKRNYWESFHFEWISTLVRCLNGTLLPKQYLALPEVHLGIRAAADVGTLELNGQPEPWTGASSAGETSTAVWTPPKPVQTLAVTYPDQDVVELRIFDEERDSRLVGALEIVSPGNKDRPENRQAFVAKCAGYLRQRVGLVIVDIVTSRRCNFHHELQTLLSPHEPLANLTDIYAAAYQDQRGQGNGHSFLRTWPFSLEIGQPLPTLPLCLTDGPVIPIDLEATYTETARVLRVEE